ncbi:ead/Ea22-like family protein [Serratia marcescens]|nr:ead/Ea22-like family protein [Serratia marcescens]
MDKLSELSKPAAFIVRSPLGDVAYRTISQTDADYIARKGYVSEPLYSQEYVSALLAELEASKQYAKSRDEENESLSLTVGRLRVELEAKDQAHRVHAARLISERGVLRERVTELEAKLATPVRLLGEMLLHDWEHSVERQATFQHRKIAWDARLAEDKKAILAAGFTFTVEGDE